jgi:hypothetical protein
MWIVAKIKTKEMQIFKRDMLKKVGNEVKFYCPKIKYQRYFNNKVKKFEKFALDNYIFCYHINFSNLGFIQTIRFTKGLKYFLEGFNQSQKEIINFINYCKSYENDEGYLTQAFFKNIITKRAKFISGPFSNIIFEIIEKQKNKLKIMVGNVVTTISDKNNYLYRPA